MTTTKTYVTLKEKYDRIVVLIDMDCFYCQVEEYLEPQKLSGKPIAVVQYVENAGIIAVNYAARALGVTRHMREKEAKAACPQLICVKVPSKNGKADLTKYRDAGYQVAKVLQTFTPLLERASVDEAYLDITENVSKRMQDMRDNKFHLQPSNFVNTFAVGYENIGSFVQDVTSSVDSNFDDVPDEDRKSYASSKLRLLVGAAIVNEVRAAVKQQTKYDCSAGIAHNKILAKLTCGMNKPNKQTVLPIESISGLFEDLTVNKVKGLGAKLGEEVCSKLNVKTMADILRFSESELQQQFQGRVGSWLYYMARGIDLEKVTPKFMSKSIAVSKNFRGKNEISSVHTLKFWLKELAKEIVERLEKDAAECNRTSKQMIVSFTQEVSSTRTVQLNGNSLNSYTAEQIADEALDTIKRNTAKFLKAEGTVIMNHNVKHLGISAGKFEDNNASCKNLQNLLKNHQKKENLPAPATKTSTENPETTKSPGVASVKKFEMKSPKGMTRALNEPKAKGPKQCEVDSLLQPKAASLKPSTSTDHRHLTGTDADHNILTSSLSFADDASIKGVKTLKHWVKTLVSDAFKTFKKYSEKNACAPSELVLKFTQKPGGVVKEHEFNFRLECLKDDVIDSDLFTEAFVHSEQFLNEAGTIKWPITQIQIVPSEFKSCDWRWTIKNDQANNLEMTVDDVEECDNATTGQSIKHIEDVSEEQQTDEEFFKNVLSDINAESDKEESAEKDSSESNSEILESVAELQAEMDCSMIDEPVSPTEVAQVETTAAPESSLLISAGTSYMRTYAEFQPQNIPLELLNPKEECGECGKLIPKLDMVSHLDHHLAFQISSQQREEYRKSLKSTPPSTQSATKRVPKPKNLPSKPANLIDRYTLKKSEPLDGEESANRIQCDECKKFIESQEYISHLDYHFAQKLRNEDLKKSVPVKEEVSRKRVAPAQKNAPKMKSLKSYFDS